VAFVNLYSELCGVVPKFPVDLAKTYINRAYKDVRRKNLWSFQLFEANWVSPAIVNAGTVTTTTGLNTVVFDAIATTALLPLVTTGPIPAPLTQRQFRIGIGTIYNIWSFANNTPSAGLSTMTLDRPYAEQSGAGQTYQVYECYYTAPYQDWWAWINVRDIINFNDLDLYTTRKELDIRDPQRSIFYIPTVCAYYETDLNPASQTYGWDRFELWGQPSYVLPYQLYGVRKGPPLVQDTDTVANAIGEDCVMELAKYYAYQWAEGQKGDMPRDAGSDFRFLMGSSMAGYKRLYAEYRKEDREKVDNWIEQRRLRNWLNGGSPYYSAIGQTAWPGLPW
jgi:hypothetical protein